MPGSRMASLPIISHGQKPTLAGTYVAEQTSKTSFDLVSVVSPRAAKTPKTNGRGEGRRRRAERGNYDAQGQVAYTVLPALSAIEPLLLRDKEGFFTPASSSSSWKPSSQAVNSSPKVVKEVWKDDPDPPELLPSLQQREEDIMRSTKRLHKGKNRHGTQQGKHLDDKSDLEAVAYLTRPKSSKFAGSGHMRSTPSSSCGDFNRCASQTSFPSRQTSPTNSKKGRLHDNHYALFAEVVPGSEVRTPQESSCMSLRQVLAHKATKKTLKPLKVISIPVVPENAVDAFFEEETTFIEKRDRVSCKQRVERALEKNKELVVTNPEQAVYVPRQTQQDAGDGSMNDWLELLDAVLPFKKIDPVRREACEAIRLFVFGAVGNEQETRQREKEKIFYETRGTYEKVVKLWKVWCALDDDRSGRVDIAEFRCYAEKVGNKKLGEKAMGALLGKKSSFAVEDMMRLIWPCAQASDLTKMKGWIKDYVNSMRRVPTPSVLPRSEYEGLLENFRFFDSDCSGSVTVDELVSSGLLDKDQAQRYLADWDEDGYGEFSELAFCHMLCPTGYRAYAEARIATDKEGNQIIYEELFGWRLKNNIQPQEM